MDQVAKRSLGRLLAEDGLVPLPRTVELVEQIARALHDARIQGIVMCDLHPEAILLDQEPGGPARVVGFGQPDERLTSGTGGGSSRYKAPEEQVGGTHDADERADQFSLAVIAYEMLSGCSPFTEDDLEKGGEEGAQEAAARRPPSSLAELVVGLPTALDDVFRRAMSFDPGQRFPRVDDFAAALRAIAEGATRAPDLPGSDGPVTAKVPVRREAGGLGGMMRALTGRGRARAPLRDSDGRVPPPMAAPTDATPTAPGRLGPDPTPPDLRPSRRAPLVVVGGVMLLAAGGLGVNAYNRDAGTARGAPAPAPIAAPPPAAAPTVVKLPAPAPAEPARPAEEPAFEDAPKTGLAASDPVSLMGKHRRNAHSRRHHGATLRSAGKRRGDRAH